jgi:hypothetical protein
MLFARIPGHVLRVVTLSNWIAQIHVSNHIRAGISLLCRNNEVKIELWEPPAKGSN